MTGDQVVRLVPGDLVLRLVEVILGGLEEAKFALELRN